MSMEKNRIRPVKSGKGIRMSYSRQKAVLGMPNLIEVQRDSYEWFLSTGLKEVLEDISPIEDYAQNLSLEFVDFKLCEDEKKYTIEECRRCHNISDGEICEICSDPKRDNTTLCVVENIKDILSIEATSQYNGLYHVLGGIISPMDGIGPADLHITSLVERVEQEPIREIIFALSATIEGDTTGYYIFKKMKNKEDLVISTIAKGISIGNDLEYTDELTLGRSIVNRVKFSFND